VTLGAQLEPAAGRPLTVEEWERLPEDEPGELVLGVLVEEEVPTYIHETTLAWLMGILLPWARTRGARVVGSGLKYIVSVATGRMPDLSVFLVGAARPPARGAVRTPPSIAVEIVSSTPADIRRDRIVKLSEYAAFGVRWYWLVDPELRTFEILELDAAAHYVHKVSVLGGRVEEIPGCPELVLELDELWRELDVVMAESDAT